MEIYQKSRTFLGHKVRLNKDKKKEVIFCIFSDHNKIEQKSTRETTKILQTHGD
jgi:hypothetical protein